jgi:hypothetical protein
MTATPTARLTRRLRLALGGAVLALSVAGALGAGAGSAGAATLTPPPVPGQGGQPTGAYLGAWVNPVQHASTTSAGASAVDELSQVGQFDADFGRPLSILHVFQKWSVPAPNSVLAAVAATGAVPLVDWHCGDSDANVASGKDDALLNQYAAALAAYGRPVFLRWYWEFNILGSNSASKCLDPGNPHGEQGFRLAWQHIWTVFHQDGATNVAFVWCPGVAGQQGGILNQFWPGASFVDWVCIDGYDRTHTGASAFTSDFAAFYHAWSTQTTPGGQQIPVMIGETGATTDQVAYLQGIASLVPTQYPDVKAVVYFDGNKTGTGSIDKNWTLSAAGLSAWTALGATPYFSFHA